MFDAELFNYFKKNDALFRLVSIWVTIGDMAANAVRYERNSSGDEFIREGN
jgi:hypothetical protein